MKTCKLVLAVLVVGLSVLPAWAGQWTYNSGSAALSHNTYGWVLAASRKGTNLTVTSVRQLPGTPSALPLSDPIPGYALVSISVGYAFRACASLTSVTIPDSVTNIIGDYAFQSCTSLTAVAIGNGVTSIGYHAFDWCTSLASVTIGNSVTNIGDYAFSWCTSLASVNIPDGVTSIGDYAFYCTSLTSLTSVAIGNGVTSIGDWAFYGCRRLTNITIPDSVTSIGDEAFSDCTSLTSITVHPENMNYASLGGVLFNKDLTVLIQCPGGFSGGYAIPDGVTSIGYRAFQSCTSLTSVTIPNSVTSIGSYAFYFDCSALASVLFTGGVPSIASYAFNTSPATLYYLPAFASTWPSTVAGRPAVCWNPAFSPASPPRFTSGTFGFTLAGNPNLPVKVEAATNLSSGVWAPITNATLNSSGSLSVTDPASSSLPVRFYRIVWP